MAVFKRIIRKYRERGISKKEKNEGAKADKNTIRDFTDCLGKIRVADLKYTGN